MCTTHGVWHQGPIEHVNGADVGRVGIDALLDRRGEHERLERRTGLAGGLRDEVELVAGIAHDGGHRANRAGARLEGDDRRGRVGLVREDVADRLVREPLQARVDRRVNLEAAFAHRVRAVLLLELVDHVGEEVRLLDARVDAARLEPERVRANRRVVLGERDVVVVDERAQHLVATVERRLRVVERVVHRRRLRQPRQERRLEQRQLAGGLREVRLRRGLDAVGVVAVVHGVQVLVEDLRLRPLARELDREARLLDLARERLLLAGVEVADELLRDRGAALDHLAGGEVLPSRARNADVVHTSVLPEAAVFDRGRRDAQPLRHLRVRDGLAVALGGNRAEQWSPRRLRHGGGAGCARTASSCVRGGRG